MFCLQKTRNIIIALNFSLVLTAAAAWGATYYVDPVSGNMANDGSYQNPWRTLQEVFEMGFIGTKVYAGDTLLLRNGYHGDINNITGHHSDYITIAAQSGHNPGIRKLKLSDASKWIIRGISISPELAPGPYSTDYLVHIRSGCYDIIIENNNLFYTEDSSGWTAAEWTSLPAGYAVYIQSPGTIIRNNSLKNVYFGIVIVGNNTLVEHNTIEHIAGDGMVGCANGITIQYNTLKNFYRVDGNHDDGIQFHRGLDETTPIENVIVRGNLIISHEPDITTPLIGQPHGIAGFDGGNTGFFRNFLVENNVILSQAYHGIALYGATDSRIMNNIVFDPTGAYPIWISLDNRGANTVVRNNMARDYSIGGIGTTADHNIDIDEYGPDALFVDSGNVDMKHRAGSPAIDSGSGVLAPDTDILGTSRPQGSGYDIGAYEYISGGNQPPNISAIPNAVTKNAGQTITAAEIERATDPEGDALTYAYSGWLNSLPYTVTAADAGIHIVHVDVQDGVNAPVGNDITITVSEVFTTGFQDLPDITALKCWNNVFNPSKGEEATISIELDKQARVTVVLYDRTGKEVKKVMDEEKQPGFYSIKWNGRDAGGAAVGAGIYMVHMKSGGYKATKKVAIIK